MRLLEIRTKIKKQAKTVIYSSLALSIIVIILGILLLTLREHIVNYIEWVILVFFIQVILINIFLFIKYKKKSFLIFLAANIITLITFMILYFFTDKDLLDIVAIFMGISAILNIFECVFELFEENHEDDFKSEFVTTIKICIEFYFAYELFKDKGASVKTHLVIFGIVFIVDGVLSIISILLSKHKDKSN